MRDAKDQGAVLVIVGKGPTTAVAAEATQRLFVIASEAKQSRPGGHPRHEMASLRSQ
jgi:hypothetical protein